MILEKEDQHRFSLLRVVRATAVALRKIINKPNDNKELIETNNMNPKSYFKIRIYYEKSSKQLIFIERLKF